MILWLFRLKQRYENLESEFMFVNSDKMQIEGILTKYEDQIVLACEYSFNGAFVLLKL